MNVSFYGSAQVQFLYWELCDNIFHRGSLDSFAYYFNTANQLYSSLTREKYIFLAEDWAYRRHPMLLNIDSVGECCVCGWANS